MFNLQFLRSFMLGEVKTAPVAPTVTPAVPRGMATGTSGQPRGETVLASRQPTAKVCAIGDTSPSCAQRAVNEVLQEFRDTSTYVGGGYSARKAGAGLDPLVFAHADDDRT